MYIKNTADFTRGLCSAFVLTGYLGQEDDLYTGREALIVHLLGVGSNHVTYLARKKRIRGVFDFILLTFLSFHFLIFEHWG